MKNFLYDYGFFGKLAYGTLWLFYQVCKLSIVIVALGALWSIKMTAFVIMMTVKMLAEMSMG